MAILNQEECDLIIRVASVMGNSGHPITSNRLLQLLENNPPPVLQPADPTVPRQAQGLIHKYNVERVDGSSKHKDCEYFVLDLTHDPYSVPAMVIYALACAVEYPQLKEDILARYSAALPSIRPSALEWMTELMEPYHHYRHGQKAIANFLSNYSLKLKE